MIGWEQGWDGRGAGLEHHREEGEQLWIEGLGQAVVSGEGMRIEYHRGMKKGNILFQVIVTCVV